MNAAQFMDKQVMDLASSTTESKVFSDLPKHPEEVAEDRNDARNGGDNIDGLRAEEIVPSYDFQPIRPVSGGTPARAWGSVDSKSNGNAPIRNYSSLDSFEPAKVIHEKDRHSHSAFLVDEIDQAMKKHVDSLLHAFDSVTARLTQLESQSRCLENSVDELKVAAGNHQGSTDGKMRHLEDILREVQNGVHVIKDKQDMMEGQLHLAKLHISKPDQVQEADNPSHVDSVLPPPPPPSLPQQQPPPSSAPFQQPVPSLPPLVTPLPPPPSQQNLPPPVPMPNQFPQLPNPSVPQREPYFPPSTPSQPQEAPNHQYQLPPKQPPLPPATAQHQQYPPQHPPQLQPAPGHHAEEPTYVPYLQPNLRQPPLSQQPQSGAPPSQQLYGAPNLMMVYEPPPGRSSVGYSSDQYPYGGSPPQYGPNSPVKSHQQSQSSTGTGYPQLPTARVLPQALPTASGINSGSGSTGNGNRVPVDDVVDKVTTMGFPRDQVRATVRKLTENGQSVDLNMVLDKLMNDSDVQPPRGWFGR